MPISNTNPLSYDSQFDPAEHCGEKQDIQKHFCTSVFRVIDLVWVCIATVTFHPPTLQPLLMIFSHFSFLYVATDYLGIMNEYMLIKTIK